MLVANKEKFLPNIWDFFRKNWLWCVVILVTVFSRICWYGTFNPYMLFPDSNGYMEFDTLAMIKGEWVNGRAPLYGVFLDFLEFIFPAHFLTVASAVQVITSAISIFILAKLLIRIGIGTPWCQFCVLFYGVTPAVWGWDTCILTESFSLSGVIVFFYFTVKYIQDHRFLDGVLSNFIALILLFLRPQFLIYLALLLVFYVLKLFFPYNKAERRTIFSLLAVQLVCWLVVFLYCAGFQSQFGIFSLSDALPRQNLIVCVDRGYYEDLDDTEVVQYLKQSLEAGEKGSDACVQAVKIYGNKRIDQTTKRYFASHFWTYFLDTVKIIQGDLGSSFYGYAADQGNYNPDASPFFFTAYPIQMALLPKIVIGHVLLASVLEGVAMIIVWIRRRTLPWMHMALFSISICTTFLTYFVTCGEYMRTMVSIIPYFICMIGIFLQMCSNVSTRLRDKL